MPTYEYICQNCNYYFFENKSINDRDNSICPRCKSINIRRILAKPNIIYNGDGFYTTDNKEKNKK